MYAEWELLKLARRFHSQFPNHCFYCGCKVKKARLKPREACAKNERIGSLPTHARTRDHIIPRVNDGFVTVTACFGCNNEKGAKSLDEFRKARGVTHFYFEWVLFPDPFRNSVQLLADHFKRNRLEA